MPWGSTRYTRLCTVLVLSIQRCIFPLQPLSRLEPTSRRRPRLADRPSRALRSRHRRPAPWWVHLPLQSPACSRQDRQPASRPTRPAPRPALQSGYDVSVSMSRKPRCWDDGVSPTAAQPSSAPCAHWAVPWLTTNSRAGQNFPPRHCDPPTDFRSGQLGRNAPTNIDAVARKARVEGRIGPPHRPSKRHPIGGTRMHRSIASRYRLIVAEGARVLRAI